MYSPYPLTLSEKLRNALLFMSVSQDDICLLPPSNILEEAYNMYNRNREKYEGIWGNSHKYKGIWELKKRIMN